MCYKTSVDNFYIDNKDYLNRYSKIVAEIIGLVEFI
jgi:hypothetical protein